VATEHHKPVQNETAQTSIAVPGSVREPLPGSEVLGKTNPQDWIEVTILVKAKTSGGVAQALQQLNSQLPTQRTILSRQQAEAAFGADPQDLAQIENFAHTHSLDVVQVSAARRSVVLAGTVTNMSAAFGVELAEYTHPGGSYRGRVGPVHIPAEIAPIVEGVFGLDDRPQAQPHFRPFEPQVQSSANVSNNSYTPVQVGQLYDFPTKTGANGQGQTIAIIELGGGYRVSDLTAYFNQLQIAPPKVVAVSVDNAHNKPTGTTNGPDGEVMLDIEVAGALAPAAQLVVYFAPNTDRGFLDAITTAIHDTHHQPSIISISWGGSESSWTAQALQAFDQAFQVAATLGITVCCAAGDNGSSDGVSDGNAHVDFPASSPHVLACGGTSLQAANNKISSEVVWNNTGGGATGGGVSEIFPLPDWQKTTDVPPSVNSSHFVGRGLPDIAGDADPATGYAVRVDKHQMVYGGTSAVAPLWAGLLALINQQLGKPVGYLNPLLYGQLSKSNGFHDISSGNNGAYQASNGWDACTGWGSPDGNMLLKALGGN
jgi:kumamolisin